MDQTPVLLGFNQFSRWRILASNHQSWSAHQSSQAPQAERPPGSECEVPCASVDDAIHRLIPPLSTVGKAMCRAQQAPSTDVRATTHNICCLVPDGSIVYCRRETNTDSGSHGTRVDGGTWVDAWETKQFQNQVGIRAQA